MDQDGLEELFRLDMRQALRTAKDSKWLGQERHGYCFSCGKETLVFDVIAEGSPVQPPKCEECFVQAAISFLESPEAQRLIKDLQDNGAKRSE
jgi:hypothetical protein